jgi:hypothetical protein
MADNEQKKRDESLLSKVKAFKANFESEEAKSAEKITAADIVSKNQQLAMLSLHCKESKKDDEVKEK